MVTSAALADALWGDTPPAKPDDQLAVLVSRLRSVLGRDRIEHRDHGYLLRCDWLDAAELAGLTEEIGRRRDAGHVMGAAAAARVALSLIRGDGPAPLPGEWAQLRRADLERLIRRARQVAATALLDAGDWMAAADAAATALEYDPYDEAALRVLLRAQVMGGRVAAALATYASTRERLADELGTDPSPETEALQLAILRGELAPPGPAPAPAALGLVGRDEELAYLDAVALRARGRQRVEVVVIDGEAGIGKTTLLRSLGRPAGGRRGHGADGHVRAARPGHAAGRAADRAGRAAAPARARGGRRPAGRRRAAARARCSPRSALEPAQARPGRQHARPRGPVRGPGPGARQAHRPGAGGGGDRRCASGGPRARRTGCASCGAGAVPLAVVAAVRPGAGEPLPATGVIHLGVLGRDAAAELVGPGAGRRAVRAIQGAPAVPHRAGPAGGRAGRCPRRSSSRCPRAATSWARPGRCCGPRR